VSLKKLGRYDLVRVLGKGAMGIVYEGRDPNLDRRVAIKTVKVENLSEEAAAEYEARFRTEARSAARLQHPNIVSVYDSDRDGDIAFLVMEFIQGDDLKHHLDRGVRYSLEQSLRIIRDLLSALDYAHKQSIVHRDIKPANLLLEPGGRVKLTDFGVARIQDSGEATRTQGSMVGTLKYMAPEQVQGQKIDSRADLFSVGVVLYQLLTDRRPFDGDNDFSIIHQIIGHTPQAPSAFNARLPSAIDAVVARALAKDREDRFATARDFATALQSAIRRAEDATIVPPADPLRKPVEDMGTGSRGGTAGSRTASPTSGTSATSATSGTSATVTQELELVYWKDIKDSADPEELEMFLEKFPAGIYGDLARRRVRKLREGTSGDQTMLSGTVSPGQAADQDVEATRLRTDLTRPVAVAVAAAAAAAEGAAVTSAVPAAPAAPADEPTRTVVEPRVPDDPVETTAVPAPEAMATSGPANGQRKRMLIGGIAVAAVAVVAAIFMGSGGGKPSAVATPAPAASAAVDPSASASASAATAVAAASAALPATTASTPVKASLTPPAPKPQRAASQRVAKPASAPVPAAPVAVQVPPAEPARDAQAKPAAPYPSAVVPPPVASAGSPNDACKDRLFLAREFCLHEQCNRAVFNSHPICVKRREEARIREESKMRN